MRRPHLLAAVLLLGLAACAAQAPAPATPPPFAADWQQHARPLIHEGPGAAPGTTSWLVPTILPRGTYKVISRDRGTAR